MAAYGRELSPEWDLGRISKPAMRKGSVPVCTVRGLGFRAEVP